MNGRILCTEDDADTREMLTILLEAEGYEVVCPADSELALELMKSLHFDLCLLDNWMPGLSGLDLTKRIREFNKVVCFTQERRKKRTAKKPSMQERKAISSSPWTSTH